MSSIKISTIEEKLRKLREVIDKLEECKKTSQHDFMVDFWVSDTTMHNLVLGIEIIVDIGSHILAEVFQMRTSEYAEVIEKLGKAQVVPEEFAKENVDMARFRNRIIHYYGDIDLKQVYQNLQKAPDIFRKFAEYFSDFLEKNKGRLINN